jgi:hypothetical protein
LGDFGGTARQGAIHEDETTCRDDDGDGDDDDDDDKRPRDDDGDGASRIGRDTAVEHVLGTVYDRWIDDGCVDDVVGELADALADGEVCVV